MASPKGSAAYKKKDGVLTFSKDQKSILWTPVTPRGAPPGVTIQVADITNLQQTPENAPKVMLKVFVKAPDGAEAITHLFHFNSPVEPRSEANAIKDALTSLITAAKASDPSVPRVNGASGSSAAMAIASAVSSRPTTEVPSWYDDNQLKADIELQQALMRKDPALHRTYEEARRTKPDTVSNTQFNAQFWSTRTSLLRAFAVESHQQRGAYNALSTIKPKTVNGNELHVSLSKEQIQLIFNQHPIMRKVYNENVPKLDEIQFWTRFIQSRLLKKLKGEKINQKDPTDPIFDKYLNSNDDEDLQRRLEATQVPHVIDIQGNDEDQGGAKGGNRPYYAHIPSGNDKMPIIRILNNLSEKLMGNVAPSDGNPADPIGMSESTYNELILKDLQGNEEEDRIILNVKDQGRFLSNDNSYVSTEASLYAKQRPADILFDLQTSLDPGVLDTDSSGGLDLQTIIGVADESDSEDEEQERTLHVGSTTSFIDAQRQVFESIAQRRTQMEGSDAKSRLSGLSQSLFDRLTLTHATTTEFLHHFWVAFLSGDPDRAGELAKMVETLDRALDRINAVAEDAEKERSNVIQKHKQHIRDVWEKTGKKIHWNPDSVGGGANVVRDMMGPTIRALDKASREYRKALAAEGVDTS